MEDVLANNSSNSSLARMLLLLKVHSMPLLLLQPYMGCMSGFWEGSGEEDNQALWVHKSSLTVALSVHQHPPNPATVKTS